MEVDGRIDGLLSQVRVRQTFVNAFDQPLEATYIFPLPDRAAVAGFRMEVAGRTIEGVLDERGKAREAYDQAIAAGQRASIAEEERPGVFTLRVGNMMPGEKATVDFKLAGILPYSNGEVTFRFPLVVAPRYIPGIPLSGPSVGDGTAVDTDDVPDASRISPPVLLPGFPNPVRLRLTIDLHDHNGCVVADGIRSSLHAIVTEEKEGFLRVRLDAGERLDRDFILRFRLGSRDPASPVLSTLSLHPDAKTNTEDSAPAGTFALTLIPPTGIEQGSRPRDAVFVLDRSGSMQGWKMVAARRAIGRMIDTLGSADRFALLAFDTVIEQPPGLGKTLVQAGDRHRFRALEFLAGIDARGGTEMAEPLNQAADCLNVSDSGRDAILVLVTDGQIGNEDQILRTLSRKLSGVRVFTLGIDRAVNEAFLRRLAELGRGTFELVESEGRLDEVMTAIHRQIGTPLFTDLTLQPEGFAIEPDSMVPERLPDLFAGTPVLVLGRFRGHPSAQLRVHARNAAGKPWDETLSGRLRENPAIASAWARGQVRKLEDRYVVGGEDLDELERQIVAVSLRFGVLSRFTAYVAIDRVATGSSGNLHRITQPVEMPQGWGAKARFRGACYGGGAPVGSAAASAAPKANREFEQQLATHRAPIANYKRLDASAPPPPAGAMPARVDDTWVDLESARPEEAAPPALPDRYESPKVAGTGSAGRTLEAFDRMIGQRVRITILRAPKDRAEEVLATLRSLVNLAHPSLVRVLDAGRVDEMLFFVEETVTRGVPLPKVLQSRKPDPADSARWVAEIAEALQYLDEHGITLPKIGGTTIEINAQGRSVLCNLAEDLGFIETLYRGEFLGNAKYIPPEFVFKPAAASGDRCGAVYSLGVVLYELLTGASPFPDEIAIELLLSVSTTTPRPPRAIRRSIPKELEAICLKAMARKPEDRYATPGELAQALRQFLGAKPDRRKSFWKPK
jgi:Ca-activated chloride channel family protein